ncbi:NAD(P)/FAD-dependent oxidoreductase [Evansella tamaricis]|uniref:FAD-binding oxidoreductase n=1 Tax=Evansella tamaricis TaxID=2069301 RepID=A0ABS6JMG4_9BACI|nr:FAD-dependent oxidoreductase [Evansella tamaricis]MBU9714037.1 FAD-binding oxidoreductase [Evansella tamaricis]
MKVVVIGAGIVGASAAYHLAKSGHEVIIVDKREDGEATAAGAGIVCPWLSNVTDPHWHQLAKEAFLCYSSLVEELGAFGEGNLGYKLVGAMRVSEDETELDRIEVLVRERKEVSSEVGEISRLDSEGVQKLFPPLKEGFGAVHVTGGARVDGRLFRDAMLRAAKNVGAIVLEGTGQLISESVDWKKGKGDPHGEGRVKGVRINGEVVLADSVVVTAGAWAKELLETESVSFSVEPQKGQILHLELDQVDTGDWPVVLPPSSHYLLAFDGGRIVVGATRETGSGFDYRVTAAGVNEVLTEALSVAPGLADGMVKDMRVGFRPVGPDVLPIVGNLRKIPGVVVANGLGASGLTLGPYIGRLAGEIVTGTVSAEFDLSPFSPERMV